MKPATKNLYIFIGVISGLAALASMAGGGGAAGLFLGFLFFAGGAIYFLPSTLAFNRDHANSTPATATAAP